jgi:hypothetical protein
MTSTRYKLSKPKACGKLAGGKAAGHHPRSTSHFPAAPAGRGSVSGLFKAIQSNSKQFKAFQSVPIKNYFIPAFFASPHLCAFALNPGSQNPTKSKLIQVNQARWGTPRGGHEIARINSGSTRVSPNTLGALLIKPKACSNLAGSKAAGRHPRSASHFPAAPRGRGSISGLFKDIQRHSKQFKAIQSVPIKNYFFPAFFASPHLCAFALTP